MTFWDFIKNFFIDLFSPQNLSPSAPPVQSKPATLALALPYVLVNEGGYTDDPNDSGGPTNFGITQADLSKYLGTPATADQIKAMTQDLAAQIYSKYYWTPLNLDQVMDQNIATCIFDTGVVRGISVGAKYAQVACNEVLKLTSPLVVDGEIGIASIYAINKAPRATFIQAYYAQVKIGYDTIVANNPSQQVFYNGWMNRANRLLTLAQSGT